MARSKDRHRGGRLSPPGAGQPPARAEEVVEAGEFSAAVDSPAVEEESLELREERLTARKQMEKAGEVVLRKEITKVPGRLELDAYREEAEIEHVPVDKVVSEKQAPWEEGDTLVVPVYEEQLVVVKRLVMREQVRIRRVGHTERRLFEDTLEKERLRIEDPDGTGAVREQYPAANEPEVAERRRDEGGGLLDSVARKLLE